MSFLGDLFGGAGDLATSAVDRIPGGKWIRGAASDAVSALSGSKEGQIVLAVISASLVSGGFTALAPVVGPQAASAAFAIPGMISGDSFSKAWVDGFTFRLAKLAHDYGPDAANSAGADMKSIASRPELANVSPEGLETLKRAAGTSDAAEALRWANMSPENLAAQYGGRVDIKAMFLNGKTRTNAFDPNGYDLQTGAPLPSQSNLGYLAGLDIPTSAPGTPVKSLRHLHAERGLMFATSPESAKKGRELAVTVGLLAPALLVLLFLKLPTKRHR